MLEYGSRSFARCLLQRIVHRSSAQAPETLMHRSLPTFARSFHPHPLALASAEARPTAHPAANNTSTAKPSDKRVRATAALTASHAAHGVPKRHIQCEDDGRSSASRRFLPTHLATRVVIPPHLLNAGQRLDFPPP